MKSKYFLTLKGGKIDETTDSTSSVELKENEIPVTYNELMLVRVCNGDLEYAKTMIRDIEERIEKVMVKKIYERAAGRGLPEEETTDEPMWNFTITDALIILTVGGAVAIILSFIGG